jgi:hypothetical protein
MTFRLLGLPEELRLAIEEAGGSPTEEARLVYEAAVNEAVSQVQQTVTQSLRELQTVIGPHGTISRVQSGGIRVSPGEGIGVYMDGVFKTNIQPNGTLVIGSDIENPVTTTEIFFVEDTAYNGEQFEAGDFLIGENSTGVSNIKWDASEGQLQFRLGATVNVYMDTDGVLKAGAGAVFMDADGVSILTPELLEAGTNSYKFVDASGNVLYSMAGYTAVSGTQMAAILQTLHNGIVTDSTLGLLTPTAGILLSTVTNRITINSRSEDVDTLINWNSGTSIIVDGATGLVGINSAVETGYALKVGGKINLTAGNTYDIDGTPHTHSGAASDGWTAISATLSYSSADDPTFVISSDADLTAVLSVRMKIRFTNNSTTFYGIITAIGSWSGSAQLITVYGGSDYNVANSAITVPYYSIVAAPLGFPQDRTKWDLTWTDANDKQKTTPTQNTWYGGANDWSTGTDISVDVPIGCWELGYSVYQYVLDTSATIATMETTLSTSNNSESDVEMTTSVGMNGASGTLTARQTSYIEKVYTLASKTTHYLLARSESANMDQINFAGAARTTVIRAKFMYL